MAGTHPSSGELGGHDGGIRVAVYMGRLQEGNPSASELVFRFGEVGSHELGHRMGFYSSNWPGLNFIHNWFSDDIMNEGRDMPSSSHPLKWDMSIPQNRHAVDEVNKQPEYGSCGINDYRP